MGNLLRRQQATTTPATVTPVPLGAGANQTVMPEGSPARSILEGALRGLLGIGPQIRTPGAPLARAAGGEPPGPGDSRGSGRDVLSGALRGLVGLPPVRGITGNPVEQFDATPEAKFAPEKRTGWGRFSDVIAHGLAGFVNPSHASQILQQREAARSRLPFERAELAMQTEEAKLRKQAHETAEKRYGLSVLKAIQAQQNWEESLRNQVERAEQLQNFRNQMLAVRQQALARPQDTPKLRADLTNKLANLQLGLKAKTAQVQSRYMPLIENSRREMIQALRVGDREGAEIAEEAMHGLTRNMQRELNEWETFGEDLVSGYTDFLSTIGAGDSGAAAVTPPQSGSPAGDRASADRFPQLPRGEGRVIDEPTQRLFISVTGGDPVLAAELARKYGWRF